MKSHLQTPFASIASTVAGPASAGVASTTSIAIASVEANQASSRLPRLGDVLTQATAKIVGDLGRAQELTIPHEIQELISNPNYSPRSYLSRSLADYLTVRTLKTGNEVGNKIK